MNEEENIELKNENEKNVNPEVRYDKLDNEEQSGVKKQTSSRSKSAIKRETKEKNSKKEHQRKEGRRPRINKSRKKKEKGISIENPQKEVKKSDEEEFKEEDMDEEEEFEERDERDEDDEDEEDDDSRNDSFEDDDFIVPDDVDDDDNESEEKQEAQIKKKHKRPQKIKPLEAEDIEMLHEKGIEVPLSTSKKLKRLRKEDSEGNQHVMPLDAFESDLLDRGKDFQESKDIYEEGNFVEEPQIKEINDDEASFDDDFIDKREDEQMDEFYENSISPSKLMLSKKIFGGKIDLVSDISNLFSSNIMENKGIKENLIGQFNEFEFNDSIITSQEYEKEIEKEREILDQDIPERIQRHLNGRLECEKEEIDSEVQWIWESNELNINKSVTNESQYKESLKAVLEMYRKEYLEMPFIYLYREGRFNNLFSLHELHQIKNLDRDYANFLSTRKKLKSLISLIPETNCEFQMLEEDKIKARNVTELSYISQYLEYYKYKMQKASEKAAVVNNRLLETLLLFFETELYHHFKELLLTPNQFYENLKYGERKHIPLNPSKDYITFLNDINLSFNKGNELNPNSNPNSNSNFNSSKYSDNEIVNKVIHNFALELFYIPLIRNIPLKEWYEHTTLTTKPTTEGIAKLDIFNIYYRCKYITKKPILTFEDDLFIDILNCEKNNLIEVVFEVENKIEETTNNLNDYYLSETNKSNSNSNLNLNANTNIWDSKIRRQIISTLVYKYILQDYFSTIRKELELKAEKYLLEICSHEFKNLLLTPPYVPKNGDEVPQSRCEIQPPKVFSFVIEKERYLDIQLAIISSQGELIGNKLFKSQLMKNTKSEKMNENKIYLEEREECKKLLIEHLPDLIVISANCLDARNLKNIIMSIAEEIKQEKEEKSLEEGESCKYKEPWTILYPINIPIIYSSSEIGKLQYPDATDILKKAISLGRLEQDPFLEIMNLWSWNISHNKVLELNLNRNQYHLNKYLLQSTLEDIAVEVTSLIGVDISDVLNRKNYKNILSFVPGLGPKRAKYIYQYLLNQSDVNDRESLKKQKLMKNVVYKNCAGFLIFNNNNNNKNPNSKRDLKINIFKKNLDDSRIHPEQYIIKETIRKEIEENDSEIVQITSLSQLSKEKIKKVKQKLCSLQHDKSINTDKIFEFILNELQSPFKDPRPEPRPVPDEILFYELINETPFTFFLGQIIPVSIVRVEEDRLTAKLQNGIMGYIQKDKFVNISDLGERDNLEKQALQQKILEARIINIDFLGFKVYLSTLKSDLITHKETYNIYFNNNSDTDQDNSKYKYKKDPFIKVDPRDLENRQYIEKESQSQNKYIPRKIIHSNFLNVQYVGCVKYLNDKPIGTFIFRPSSKGLYYLTLTIKVYDETYLNISINEFDKMSEELLGTKLEIEGTSYGNLTEIIGRFVHPIVNLFKDAISYPKFVKANDIPDLKSMMKQQYISNNSQSHYCITIIKQYPRNIILAYIFKPEKVIIEFVKVDFKGLIFHENIYSNTKNLVNWFKQNFGSEEYLKFLKKNPEKNKINPHEENFNNNPGEKYWRDNHEEEINYNIPSNINDQKTTLDQNNEPYQDSKGFHKDSQSYNKFSRKSEYSQNSQNLQKCFNCHSSAHIKRNCPYLKRDQVSIEMRSFHHHAKERKYQDDSYHQNYEDAYLRAENREQNMNEKIDLNQDQLVRGLSQNNESQFNLSKNQTQNPFETNWMISTSNEQNFEKKNNPFSYDSFEQQNKREYLAKDRRLNERIRHNSGYEGHNPSGLRNFQSLVCYFCKQSGHKEKFCPQKKVPYPEFSSRRHGSKFQGFDKYRDNSHEFRSNNPPKEFVKESNVNQFQIGNEDIKEKPEDQKKNNYDNENAWEDINN